MSEGLCLKVSRGLTPPAADRVQLHRVHATWAETAKQCPFFCQLIFFSKTWRTQPIQSLYFGTSDKSAHPVLLTRFSHTSWWNWPYVNPKALRYPTPKLIELLHRSSCPARYAVARWLAGPYHLGDSSLEPEAYICLERPCRLVLAKAAHILKLDRYRED